MPVRPVKLYHAFRFVHPDLDAGDAQLDPSGKPPPNHSGLRLEPRGSIAMVEADDSVRQAVLLLLSTRPGERLMHPTYGCNLFQLVFAPNDDTTAAIAVHHVRRALQQWEQRINILTLDAQRDPYQGNILVITLKYQVRATRHVEQLNLSLNLAGEES